TQAASGVLAFAATWLATRGLGVGGYGGLAAILAASQITGQIVLDWSAVSLWRYGCEEFVHSGKITAAFWTRLMVLGANLLFLILTAWWWLPAVTRWFHLAPPSGWIVLAHLS